MAVPKVRVLRRLAPAVQPRVAARRFVRCIPRPRRRQVRPSPVRRRVHAAPHDDDRAVREHPPARGTNAGEKLWLSALMKHRKTKEN